MVNMLPRTKLCIANVLMSIGLIPLTLLVVLLVDVMTWTPARHSVISMPDPLALIGIFAIGFIFTLAVAGVAAAWSWDVARAHPEQRSRTALGLRLLTALILISPFVLVFLMQFLPR